MKPKKLSTKKYGGWLICKMIMVATVITVSGCKKFIEIDGPNTSVSQKNVYSNNSNAISAVTGIYTKMANSPFSLNFSLFPELSADNLALFDLTNMGAKMLYLNSLNPKTDDLSTSFWIDTYSYVYDVNAAIEGLNQSTTLTENVKTHLLGEVYFLRGFYYFYLVNLYGDVPLVIKTDYTVSSIMARTPSDVVYQQIISDLKLAQNLLLDNYVNGTLVQTTTERTRPNKMTATALLSRVYLFTKNYKQGAIEATKVINESDSYAIPDLASSFLKNSSETIWALQPVANNTNTMEGNFFNYTLEGPNSVNYSYISSDLIADFEAGDLRKDQWVGVFTDATNQYYFPFKYKVKDGDPSNAIEYTIVFRLAEQYLIRAECQIEDGNISSGIADLNKLRSRARATPTAIIPNPLPDLNVNLDLGKARTAILHERRVELFAEWGNRWFDLKRTGKLNEAMEKKANSLGIKWNSYQSLYPIPFTELLSNPNLKQNIGYN